MNHQRQHAHADPAPGRSADDDEVAPGRTSRSAQLSRPEHPVEPAWLQAASPANDAAHAQDPAAAAHASAPAPGGAAHGPAHAPAGGAAAHAPAGGAARAPDAGRAAANAGGRAPSATVVNLDAATHGNATGFDGSTPTLGGKPAAPASWRPTDGMVDYYMETHWAPERFHEVISRLGYPDSAPTSALSEIDRLLPQSTPPEVRATINLAVAIGGGVLDTVVMSGLKAAPITGIAVMLFDSARAGLESYDKYGKLEDSFGQWMGIARACFDFASGAAGNLASLVGYVEFAADKLAKALLVTGALPAAGAVEQIAVTAKLIKLALVTITTASDAMKLVLDAVLFFHDQSKADEAEARGDFATAGKYRDLAQGTIIDGFGDSMALAGDMIDLVLGIVSTGTGAMPDGALKSVLKTSTTAAKLGARFFVKPKLAAGATGAQVGGGVRQNVTGLGGTIGAVGGTYHNIAGQVGVGDAMLGNDDLPLGRDYVDRDRGGGGEGAIAAARAQTVAALDGDERALEGDTVHWYEQLLNEILEAKSTDAGDVAQAMTPSGVIKLVLGQIPSLLGKLSPDNLDAVASGAESIAAAAQSVLGPVLARVTAFIQEVKPQLDPIVQGLAQKVASSQVNVERIRGIVATVAQAAAKVQEWVGPVGQVEAATGDMLGKLGSAQVSRAKLNVPEAVPDAMLGPAIAAVNAPVAQARAAVQAVRGSLVEQVRGWIAEKTAMFAAKLAQWQAMLAENSKFVEGLRAAHAQVQQLVAQAVAAFAKWDGTIKLDLAGAGAWLHQLGTAARKAKEAEAASGGGGAGGDRAQGGASAGGEPGSWPAQVQQGRQWIDEWKGRNAARVESQFHTQVPAHELAAVTQYYQAAKARAAGRPTDALDRAHAECMAFSGQQGREALYGLWQAEDRLIAAAHALDRAAAGPGPGPAPGQPGSTTSSSPPGSTTTSSPPGTAPPPAAEPPIPTQPGPREELPL